MHSQIIPVSSPPIFADPHFSFPIRSIHQMKTVTKVVIVTVVTTTTGPSGSAGGWVVVGSGLGDSSG